MHNDTIDHFANLARNKADTLLPAWRITWWVTLANVIGCSLFIGLGYWFVSHGRLRPGADEHAAAARLKP